MTRVLVVDDKAENLYLLRALLEGHGCEVDEARHGAEALVKARLAAPDVVISDLLMPVMDGYTLLRHWKSDERLWKVPFVVYTATYTDPRDEQLALDLGADAFILKPAEPEPFVARIREICADRTLLERAPKLPLASERVQLREYNEVLVRKLEEKALELERSNRELSARESRLRAILDGEPECVKLLDAEGRVLEMNPAGLRMLEADSLAQLQQHGLVQCILPEDRPAFAALTERVMRGETATLEFRVVGLKGGRRWLETHASPLRDASGVATALLGITRDITESKRFEAELREAEQQLQLAVSAGKVALWNWDLHTHKVRNSAERQRPPASEAEQVSDDFAEWQRRIHPEDLAGVLRSLETYRRGAAPDYEERFRFRHEDGSYRHVLLRGSEVRAADGTRIRLVGAQVDVTELAELQSRLLQAQKLESVGMLAGGIAHDFNNLLTVINGTTDLVMSRLKPADPLRGDLEQIRRVGDRAATLIGQLLAFSRKQVIQPEVLDLNAVVAGMLEMLRRLIGEHIQVSFAPAAELGNVKADSGQIEQVIANLAVNAQAAMPDGGTLTVETRNLELDVAHAAALPPLQPGPHVMLAIRDTGIGMSEATRARIFEPFFTTKAGGRGSGLGLSTVYGIVEETGGSISVHSELGRGTSFEIYLPRIDEAVRAPRSAPSEMGVRGHEIILLVEDEGAVRDVARRVLESAGYTVLEAASGAEALALLEREAGPVHLLLTDVVMPRMSGSELSKRITALHPEMRVLYTSGYADDDIFRQPALKEGVQFISKPYSIADLTRKVRETLDL